MAAAAGQVRNVLCRPARLQIAVLVGETDDGIRVSDIDPLRIRARRIKVDAERFDSSHWQTPPSAGACQSLVIPRKILMSPALVSATKMSPLGAVRMIRGSSRPAAYCPP